MDPKYRQILKDISNKIYKPVYFLTGDEPYYIDKITSFAHENILKPEERDFNETIFYGRDSDVINVIESAKRFPMMANCQLIIVKEAQYLKNIEKLASYVAKPMKSTVLIINYKHKKLDKRKKDNKKLFDEVKKNGVFFESKKIYDSNIPSWIKQYLAHKKFEIEPKAAIMLTEYLGNDLNKISNELEKLILILRDNKIKPSHIEENIGISKDYNNFELQNAIGKRDIQKANKIVDYFIKNPKDNPAIVSFTVLYNFFVKILIFYQMENKSNDKLVASTLKVNPFFIKDYKVAARNFSPSKIAVVISMLREYNLKTLGVGNVSIPEGELLRELVFKILH